MAVAGREQTLKRPTQGRGSGILPSLQAGTAQGTTNLNNLTRKQRNESLNSVYDFDDRRMNVNKS